MGTEEENEKLIMERLCEEMEKTKKLEYDIREKYLNAKTNVLKKRQELIFLILTISSGVLGLSALFKDNIEKVVITEYFIVGIFTYFIILPLGFAYLRNHIDKDLNQLGKDEIIFIDALREKINICNEYLEEGDFTRESYVARNKKIIKAESIKKAIKPIKKEKLIDYFIEFIIFLFTSASFFIFISFLQININIGFIIFIILVIFAFSFFDFTIFISKFFSKIFIFLKKFINDNIPS